MPWQDDKWVCPYCQCETDPLAYHENGDCSSDRPDFRIVEDLLRPHFQQADAYRYNSASIRVRVIDSRFQGLSREERVVMVETYLDILPVEVQRDIVTLFLFSPSEVEREHTLNNEFDNPSPSVLAPWII